MSDGNVSVKANRINITDPVYCMLTMDTKESVTYGEVKNLGEAMQVQITPGVSSGSLFGNGVKQEDLSLLTSIAMQLDVNKVKIEARAEILGHEYKNGIMIEKGGDEPPYIAVGYKVEQTNQKAEYVWLLKGRAQPINDNVQQRTDSINFSTNTLNVNFIPRDHDSQLRYFADSANDDLTKEQMDKWFTKGPEIPVAPTVSAG